MGITPVQNTAQVKRKQSEFGVISGHQSDSQSVWHCHCVLLLCVLCSNCTTEWKRAVTVVALPVITSAVLTVFVSHRFAGAPCFSLLWISKCYHDPFIGLMVLPGEWWREHKHAHFRCHQLGVSVRQSKQSERDWLAGWQSHKQHGGAPIAGLPFKQKHFVIIARPTVSKKKTEKKKKKKKQCCCRPCAYSIFGTDGSDGKKWEWMRENTWQTLRFKDLVENLVPIKIGRLPFSQQMEKKLTP